MADKSWKRSERRVAAIVGGVRVPVTGRACGDVPDVAHPTLSIEVKTRKELPMWLLDPMSQAKSAATGGMVSTVIRHLVGQRFDEALVVRLRDVAALIAVEQGQVPDDAGK